MIEPLIMRIVRRTVLTGRASTPFARRVLIEARRAMEHRQFKNPADAEQIVVWIARRIVRHMEFQQNRVTCGAEFETVRCP